MNIEAAQREGRHLLFRNAGVLFFAKSVRHFFNQAYITCLLAKGADKVHVLDRKDFDGGVVADIEDAMRFIERNTRTAWRIEALRRENIPEYPMKALREAITNAAMHRDWFMDGANVFVELYTDRIEVSSPGGLPKGMRLADLGRKNIRRNALIADLLHRIEFIEKAGTGIKRIRDDARSQGCPEPQFEEAGFFTATFYPNPEVRAQAEVQTAAHITDQTVGTDTPQVPHKYPTSTRQVLAALASADHPLSRTDLQEAAGLRDRVYFVHEHLNPLLVARLIEMTMPDKPRSSKQRYRLTQAGTDYVGSMKKKR